MMAVAGRKPASGGIPGCLDVTGGMGRTGASNPEDAPFQALFQGSISKRAFSSALQRSNLEGGLEFFDFLVGAGLDRFQILLSEAQLGDQGGVQGWLDFQAG